jgi:hypothetical protein
MERLAGRPSLLAGGLAALPRDLVTPLPGPVNPFWFLFGYRGSMIPRPGMRSL